MPNSSSPPRALPPPMTVGRYVRESFKARVRPYVSWFAISAPVLGAMRIRESGFAWWKLSLIPVAWALACALACVAAVVILAIAGWFKIHTRIKPIIPASVAMVLAILGYVLMVNLY